MFSLFPPPAHSFFIGPTVININIIISGACRASPRIIPVDAAAWGEPEGRLWARRLARRRRRRRRRRKVYSKLSWVLADAVNEEDPERDRATQAF
jgi:hypothetical protein